ncbi:hypothetical protein B0T17DRAFT_507436 [Bombardia bombarda]|uniref:Uncharacterized protein n=1 Tax=Bombardia bombarda TaxID=252184 RepID=A0AA40CA05_9PEZI|nr:hypothetical protein B0T17DRAFT_507436 [Bombardia bombarda]
MHQNFMDVATLVSLILELAWVAGDVGDGTNWKGFVVIRLVTGIDCDDNPWDESSSRTGEGVGLNSTIIVGGKHTDTNNSDNKHDTQFATVADSEEQYPGSGDDDLVVEGKYGDSAHNSENQSVASEDHGASIFEQIGRLQQQLFALECQARPTLNLDVSTLQKEWKHVKKSEGTEKEAALWKEEMTRRKTTLLREGASFREGRKWLRAMRQLETWSTS